MREDESRREGACVVMLVKFVWYDKESLTVTTSTALVRKPTREYVMHPATDYVPQFGVVKDIDTQEIMNLLEDLSRITGDEFALVPVEGCGYALLRRHHLDEGGNDE